MIREHDFKPSHLDYIHPPSEQVSATGLVVGCLHVTRIHNIVVWSVVCGLRVWLSCAAATALALATGETALLSPGQLLGR
jgi:hypothetical protein